MASGTIILSSTRNVLEGRINWSSSSNGSNANTSNVWAELQVRRNDGYTTTGTWTGAMNIGGQEKSFSVHTSVGSSWVTMISFTKSNVPHNDNGTGTCAISGYCNGPSGTSMSGESVSGSQTVTLDTIARYLTFTVHSIRARTINTVSINWATDVPRNYTQYSLNGQTWTDATDVVSSDNKSGYYTVTNLSPNTNYTIKTRCRRTDSGLYTESGTISFTTYDYAKLTSVPNVNIGASQTIKWTNPNNASTSLKLCKTNNSQIINYGTVTGTSKTVTPTASTIYALTPNSNTYTARYILTTTQNGKNYTNSRNFTFTVTNSNPTFSNFTYVDSNTKTSALTGNNQYLINAHSSVKATITTANKAVAKNSASMKTYRLSVGNKTKDASYSSSATVNIELTNISSNTITVYAIDSRNNSTSKTISATKYINYSDINIKNIALNRSDGGVGQRVTLTYNGYIWNGNFGAKNNSIKSIKYEYKKSNSSTWITGKTTLNPTLSGNNYSQTIEIQGDLAGEGFSRESAFDFRITVTDELSTATKTVVMTSGIPLLAYARNGIAILMPYDNSIDAALQVSGNVKADKFIGNLEGVADRIKINARNTTDTWIPVVKDDTLQYTKRLIVNSKTHSYYNTEQDRLVTLSVLSYWNGAYNASNVSNLTYCSDGEIQSKPTILYNNTTGSNGTITLSSSANNFTYIEIFFRDTSYNFYNSVKVYSPNNKIINLSTTHVFSQSGTMFVSSRKVLISGTSIKNQSGAVDDYGVYASWNNEVEKTNRINIVKVNGYK